MIPESGSEHCSGQRYCPHLIEAEPGTVSACSHALPDAPLSFCCLSDCQAHFSLEVTYRCSGGSTRLVMWRLDLQAVEVLSGERSMREVTAPEALQAAYRAATGLPTSGAAASQQPAGPIEGECPICYDELSVNSPPASSKSCCWSHSNITKTRASRTVHEGRAIVQMSLQHVCRLGNLPNFALSETEDCLSWSCRMVEMGQLHRRQWSCAARVANTCIKRYAA